MGAVLAHCCFARFGAYRFECGHPGRRSFLALPWAGLWLGLRPAAAVSMGHQAGDFTFINCIPVSSTPPTRSRRSCFKCCERSQQSEGGSRC